MNCMRPGFVVIVGFALLSFCVQTAGPLNAPRILNSSQAADVRGGLPAPPSCLTSGTRNCTGTATACTTGQCYDEESGYPQCGQSNQQSVSTTPYEHAEPSVVGYHYQEVNGSKDCVLDIGCNPSCVLELGFWFCSINDFAIPTPYSSEETTAPLGIGCGIGG